MKLYDIIHFTWQALIRHRVRTLLMLSAMMIGVAATSVLTGLGEGARRFITQEFASLGTNLIIIIPGRTETVGSAASLFAGETPRDLTHEDAFALQRISNVRRVAPIIIGSATASWNGVERDSPILGSNHELLALRHWQLSSGRFLPPLEMQRGSSVCVIGENLKKELFGHERAIGQWLRIGEYRFRVIGVLASQGRSIEVDVENIVIIPVANAQALFNSPSLFRILVEADRRSAMTATINRIETILAERHQGEKDVTIVTQDAVLGTFDTIFHALTYALGGIAAISLLVAGILIMNIMLVAVTQRTAEIGLLKALGASQSKIIVLFLTEAAMLALIGASLGVLFGELVNAVIRHQYPNFPVATPIWASAGAVIIALACGLIFGAMPAKRAAELNPVEALAHK